MRINTTTLYLSLLSADGADNRPNLEGVNVKNGTACATDGTVLGCMPESGGFEGFIPSIACKAVLKGVKKDSTFQIDGEYLTRNDGVSFKMVENRDRGDFPDYACIMRDESSFKINESIKLDLSLLTRFENFLRRSGLATGVEMSFDDHMASVVLVSGEFTGVTMPMRKA
jgi:hypothetical protein